METTREGHRQGRAAIEAWAAAHPANYFLADGHFQRVISHLARPARLGALIEDLERFGAEASAIDGLARENDALTNHPRLNRYTPHGARIESIIHHPTYHEIGRVIYGSNVMAAYADHQEEPNTLGVLARFYVSSFNGEAGHNCPLACTAGVIRVLQELGTDALRAEYLPGFLNADYAHHLEGAQFLTEVQGGSDVGQNATQAAQAEDGTWRITGEKWFCSNVDADVYLMTARLPDTNGDGTRGLGLFLVPRILPDGTTNGVHIRRLKEKLGTRSMASGECDFREAVGHHMGEVGAGFKHMMELVITTSRLFNAVGCCGIMRRVWLDAARYARHRVAFGTPIERYPLVQETLADLCATTDTLTSGALYLASAQDALEEGAGAEELGGFMRLAVGLNKLITAKLARAAVIDGIEVFGGNGAIETFSVLPRLLRDSIVYENWEGTHNTLLAQALRDMHRYRVHEPFFAHLASKLRGDSGVEATLRGVLEELRGAVDHTLTLDPARASLCMRPLGDRLATLMHAAIRAEELSDWLATGLDDETAAHERASLHHFVQARVLDQRTPDDPEYLTRIALVGRLPR